MTTKPAEDRLYIAARVPGTDDVAHVFRRDNGNTFARVATLARQTDAPPPKAEWRHLLRPERGSSSTLFTCQTPNAKETGIS
ncbi:hypothetical protein [Clavibacter nebraskensis]|uniref:hypothetical protein n=1 Tax=Clavibacter nebraskensis TaxID=31963 RepID=UPI003F4BEF7E